MSKIRILIADDHAIVREGLAAILEKYPDLEVVGEAENGREAVSQTAKLNPDLVLMDISMPELNGLVATRQINKQQPDVRILILSMHTNKEYVLPILKAGASGYLVKKNAHTELVTAIKSVTKGYPYLSPSVSGIILDDYIKQSTLSDKSSDLDTLTDREREILQLIAEGCSTREIANKLFISINTVATHRSHLMKKLDRYTIAELTQYAIQTGLVLPE